MLIGGKEYKTGQRIKIINAKSILHYKYGITGDCNKDMTGITGVITAEMQITDIITEHSLKNGTVSFIYELDGKKRMQLIPWNELTKRSEKH